MESEEERLSLSSTSRVPRALTLIAASILAIAVAAIAYLHPSFVSGSALHPVAAPADELPSSYRLAAVDFVTPTTGWVVMEIERHDFAVLHTTNAGDTWSRQLGGSAGVIGEYARFFDPSHGVVALLGPQAVLYQTSDGGRNWSRHALAQGGGYIWSADFVDANHGWLLAQASIGGARQREELLRTVDGGRTWEALGNPVLSQDWAFRVDFADVSDGWLYSQSAGPYAYKSADGGTSWSRVPLPAPAGGWPAVTGATIATGEFFVAAHPTQGAGVMATVIGIAPPNGRSPAGGVLIGYPPLRVGTYDGGRPVTYVYADVSPYRYSSIERGNPAPSVGAQAARQSQLSSVDGGVSWKAISPPSSVGSIGYVDALNWWWIGSGAGSTSSDAGSTWTRTRSLGVPEPLPGSLQFTDATHAWFGAMAGPRPLVETTADGGIHWSMALLPALTST